MPGNWTDDQRAVYVDRLGEVFKKALADGAAKRLAAPCASTKTNRLFVCGDGATDGVKLFCGGPGIQDALKGLATILEMHVENLLSEGGQSELTLVVKAMTDTEVEALPDM